MCSVTAHFVSHQGNVWMYLTYSLVHRKVPKTMAKSHSHVWPLWKPPLCHAQSKYSICSSLREQFLALSAWNSFPLCFSPDNQADSSCSCTIQFKHRHLQKLSLKCSRSPFPPSVHRATTTSTCSKSTLHLPLKALRSSEL